MFLNLSEPVQIAIWTGPAVAAITETGFTIAAYCIPGAITNTLPFSWIAHGPGPA